MHTNETIGNGRKFAALEKNQSQTTYRNTLNGGGACGRTDSFGYFYYSTLTERVVGFLESYHKAAYGLR